MLCDACTKIFDTSPKERCALTKDEYKHHDSVHEIEMSAATGCHVCNILWDKFTDEERTLIRNTAATPLSFRRRMWLLFWLVARVIVWPLMVYFFEPLRWKEAFAPNDLCKYGWHPIFVGTGWVSFRFGSKTWKEIELCLIPCDETLVRSAPVDEEMGSDGSWKLVERWIEHCSPHRPDHTRCHGSVKTAQDAAPSRLIDVRAGATKDRLRLISSRQEREALPYMTLSYCWGPNVDQSQLPLLRRDSSAAFHHDIPELVLPPLFRDVVDVARKLGFRYLWIDAYCILQQDEQDWQDESARMGEIYQQALLNIAAGRAQSANSRLKGCRNRWLVEPCQVDIDWRNLALLEDENFRARGSFLIFDSKYTDGQALDSPLNRRSWVLQEQQLSPRILDFGKHQLFWHCWSDGIGQACETFPEGIMPVESFPKAHSYGLRTSKCLETGEIDQIGLALTWHTLLTTYSRCDITHETDRLIAISGLARLFAKAMNLAGKEYAAGLWRITFPWSLCWEVDGSSLSTSPASTRYKSKYVAPSWSWASVKGHIRTIHAMDMKSRMRTDLRLRTLCEDFEVDIQYSNLANPFGQVKSGKLSFLGALVPNDRLIWLKLTRRSARRGQSLNTVTCVVLDQFPSYIICNLDDMEDFETRKHSWLGLPILLKAPEIELLPLTCWEHPTDDMAFEIEGLLVVAVEGAPGSTGSRCYRRIGYFSSAEAGIKRTGLKPLNLLLHTGEKERITLI